jgi:Calx-beta domain
MRRNKGRGRTAVVAGSLATALIVTGVVIGAASSAHADETFTPTCTMYVDASPILTFNPALTLGVDAPPAAPPGAVITVTVNAHPEDLPTSDANPQNLVAYQDIFTSYVVAGGTVVPGSEQSTSGATIKTFAIPSHIIEGPHSVASAVDGPIPPGTFVPPAFTFQVLVDPSASAVTFTALQHEETADFDGPGPAQSGASTCPINAELASTTVDPNATTTTLESATTSTTATTTTSSTSSSTTTSIGGTTTTTVGGTTTTTLGGTTTTTIGPPPPPSPFYIGDPTIVEPGPNTQGHLSFTVIRTDSSKRAKVHFRTMDGTAKHKVDYNLRDFSAEFARGKPAITIYVTVKHDPNFTIGRWFTVEISDPKTGAVFGTAIATITQR